MCYKTGTWEKEKKDAYYLAKALYLAEFPYKYFSKQDGL